MGTLYDENYDPGAGPKRLLGTPRQEENKGPMQGSVYGSYDQDIDGGSEIYTSDKHGQAGPFQTNGRTNGSHYADNTLGAIRRREWDDYKRNHLPELRRSIDYATLEQPVNEAMQRAGSSVDRAYNTAEGSHQRNLSRYGATEKPDEKQNRLRLTAMNQSGDKATAQNLSRLQVQDLQNQLMAGDMSAGLSSGRANIGE